MTYVTVREETEEKLHLAKEPSSRAWAILLGIISIGIGAAYYSVDYLLWKMAYVSGAVFVGLSCMEDWEECILDKASGKVQVKRQSLVQKLFQATQGPQVVVAELEDAVSVTVDEEDIRYGAKGYLVVMNFASGFSIGVTESAIIADKSDTEFIAEKIRKFLQLESKAVSTPVTEEDKKSAEEAESESTTSDDDSFEQIDKAELVGDIAAEPSKAVDASNIMSEELDKQD